MSSPLPASVRSRDSTQRLLSLDVFRGMTILAMVLVNNPGTWGAMYGPLGHAEWFGWTPTDLIFPFFLFIVGTSLAYALRKYREGATIAPAIYWRIGRRTAVLILLGLGMGLFGKVCDVWWGSAESIDWQSLRFPGVLQRIALVYLAASLIALHVDLRGQIVLAAVLLVGYWAALAWLPRGGDFASNLSPTGNVVRVVDRAVLSDGHLYMQGTREPTDPEGLLSTLPAIVTALLGYWSGLLIQQLGVRWRTVAVLAAAGFACAALGLAWGEWLPIGKKLWTSSFVMLSGGLAMVALAACLALFDISGWRRAARPFEIMGVNAIFVFVASGLVARLLGTIPATLPNGQTATVHAWIYQAMFVTPIGKYMTADPRAASLAMALATVAAWWVILWLMARRGWSVRV